MAAGALRSRYSSVPMLLRYRWLLVAISAYALGLILWFELFFWLAIAFAGLILACVALVTFIMLLIRVLLRD